MKTYVSFNINVALVLLTHHYVILSYSCIPLVDYILIHHRFIFNSNWTYVISK